MARAHPVSCLQTAKVSPDKQDQVLNTQRKHLMRSQCDLHYIYKRVCGISETKCLSKTNEIKPHTGELNNHAICFPISLFWTAVVFSWRLVSSRAETDGQGARSERVERSRSMYDPVHIQLHREWASDYANRADITSRQRACPAVLNGLLFLYNSSAALFMPQPTRESRTRRAFNPFFFSIRNVSDANCGCRIIIIFPQWRMGVRDECAASAVVDRFSKCDLVPRITCYIHFALFVGAH